MIRFKNPFNVKKRYEKSAITVDSAVMRGIQYTQNIAGRPNFNEWDVNRAITYGYKASTWVYTSVNKLSRAAASVEWLCYRKNADGTKGDRWPDHPFEQLMKEPNPFTNGQDWRERTYQHLWLSGNGVSRIVSLRNVPVALVQMMPNAVKPVPDDVLFLNGYDLFGSYGGKTGHLENSEILHFMFTDPSNMYWGISPLQAVAKTVDTDNEAVNWNKVSLQNRAVSDGVFTVNTPISTEEWNELRDEVREQAQGSDNAHNPWVLGYGMQWNPMSLTPIEMDFLESRKNNRTEILAVYGMPPPMAGIYDEATYNNVHTARLIWWLETIIPFLDDIKVALVFGIAKRFGDDFVVDYDLSNVDALQQLKLERIDAGVKLWQMGVPLSVINSTLDLGLPDDIPGADRGYLPLSYYPIGTSNPSSTTTPIPASSSGSKFVLPKTIVPNGHNSTDKLILPDGTNGYIGNGHNGHRERKSKSTSGTKAITDNKDERRAYFEAFDKTRIPWENKLQSMSEEQLNQDFDDLANIYKENGETGIINANLEMRLKWKNLFYQFSVTLVDIVGTSFYDQLVGKKSKSAQLVHAGITDNYELKQDESITDQGSFLWQDPDLLEYLDNWCAIEAGRLVDTTLEDVISVARASAVDGASIPEIARDIRKLKDTTAFRSNMIARTQVVGFHNFAHNEAARQSNVVDQKTWISSGDSRVRETHQEANIPELTIGIDDLFQIGDSRLEFPGDPNGSVEEIIQCRCAVAYSQLGLSELTFIDEEYPIPEEIPEDEIVLSEKYGVNSYWEKETNDGLIRKKFITEGAAAYGISNEEFTRLLNKHLQQIVDNSEISVRRSSDTLARILDDGKFKTCFNSGTSASFGGSVDFDRYLKIRKKFEDDVEGLPTDLNPNERPVSGYLNNTGDVAFNNYFLDQYGDAAITLKNDVRERTTVTFGDSLDNSGWSEWESDFGYSMCPEPITEVTHNALNMDEVYYNLEAKETLTAKYEEMCPYVETQIHGGITVSDIDHVTFKHYPDESITEMLDELDIPWDVYDQSKLEDYS